MGERRAACCPQAAGTDGMFLARWRRRLEPLSGARSGLPWPLAKVLTVSDGVVAGTREDRSGDVAVEVLTAAGFEVVERRVVADGVDVRGRRPAAS